MMDGATKSAPVRMKKTQQTHIEQKVQPKKSKQQETSQQEEEQLPKNGNNVFHLDNSRYEGEWQRFETGVKRHGKGKLITSEFTYEGDFYEDAFHGKGKMEFSDGSVYEGDFLNGSITGTGKMKFSDGSVYEGEWRDGRMNGRGSFITVLNESWEGQWSNGLSVCPIFPQVLPPEPQPQPEEEDIEEDVM